MARTPEGVVKDAIKDILTREGCWFHMPVLNGMGQDTVDFHGARRADGRAFIIEAKAPGGVPTSRQLKRLREAKERNVATFVLDGNKDHMRLFRVWITLPWSASASAAEQLIDSWLSKESKTLDD